MQKSEWEMMKLQIKQCKSKGVKKQQLEPDMDNGHETTILNNSSKLGKEYEKGCILSPCLFNLYAEYIMWNARLDESQAGIKIARRNINSLRYADNTTLTLTAY